MWAVYASVSCLLPLLSYLLLSPSLRWKIARAEVVAGSKDMDIIKIEVAVDEGMATVRKEVLRCWSGQ